MMDLSFKLEEHITLLESTKIIARKKGCDSFNELLHSKSTIKFIKENGRSYGNRLLNAIESCLIKDSEKKFEEDRKKGIVSGCAVIKSADLFADFVRIMLREGVPINIRKLVIFIRDALRSEPLKKYSEQKFLKTIYQCILLHSNTRSDLQSQDWEDLFFTLKSLIETKPNSDIEQIKCLNLIIKWGPLCKFPVGVYRQQFAFITDLCKCVSSSSPIPQQEAVLDVVYEFCKHTAKDNRMGCCKLGEEIFANLIEIYERNSKEDQMKSKLIDFFLLQVVIHNPKGVTYSNSSAYAVSWETWKGCLQSIYYLLIHDIQVSLESNIRNQSLFVSKNGARELMDNFLFLFVEVCRQIFEHEDGNASGIFPDSDSDERACKRPKIEIGINSLIDKVKESNSWTWISLITAIIETYPSMLSPEEYSNFLQTLSVMQLDCKDLTLRHHIYVALLVMHKIQTDWDNEMESLWSTIASSVLRSISLKQNEDDIQRLIQSLIRKNLVKCDHLFQSYCSEGVLNVTEQSLETLEIAFKHFPHLQGDRNLKANLMKWILNPNTKIFFQQKLANILACLILKQWPDLFGERKSPKRRPFEDIEDIYLTINFESDLLESQESQTEVNSSYCADPVLLSTLINLVMNLVNECEDNNIDHALNITILLFNVTSYLIEFHLIDDINNWDLFQTFKSFAETVFNQLSISFKDSLGRYSGKTIEQIKMLNALFSTKINVFVTSKLREIVPQSLLKNMFHGLNSEVDESDLRNSEDVKLLKTALVETLTTFSCLPDLRNLLAMQEKAFESILGTEFDCRSDLDYALVTTILHSIKSCGTNFLPNDPTLSVFNLLQNICEARYLCYSSAVKILELFHEVYPLIMSSRKDIKTQFVGILAPFYENSRDYGPEVSVNLIKCMGLLYELDTNCEFSLWSGEEIVFKIPEFLSSDYQEVRYAAIESLGKFFRISSQIGHLEQYRRQEVMFSKIFEMSLKVFEIEGDVSRERMIDEAVTRCSSVLHTFAYIMESSDLWVEEALFRLLKIVSDKKIDKNQVYKIVSMVAVKLGFKGELDFLEKHLVSLFNKWKNYSMDSFPFEILRCKSDMEFLTKYWHLLAPLIVETDKGDQILEQISACLQRSLVDLIEECSSLLLSYCIAKENSDLTLIKNNKIYQLLVGTLGMVKLKEVFSEKVEEVLLNLINLVSDENDFKKIYGNNVIFPKCNDVHLTVEQFHSCVEFVESVTFEVGDKNLISHLLENHCEKIHRSLLMLKSKIQKTRAREEKLKNFHQYLIMVELYIDRIKKKPVITNYLLRDITCTLLHLIGNYKSDPCLSLASCNFFKIFLQKTLPVLSESFSKFFLVVVSRLKNIALADTPVNDISVEILKFLIVDNVQFFSEEIRKLDSFPQIPEFEEIYTIHHQLKYDNRNVSLRDEIQDFLDFAKYVENFEECEHGLKHLHNLLSSRKDELKILYRDLRQTRGFSEDCANSILHQLICVLIRLTSSTNNVSIEATRCLGEIGPADLATLVLQPEKPIADPKWSPWELTCGSAVSLLSKYIIDSDVDVVKVASEALFKVLGIKEGKKVAESVTDFGFGKIDCDYLVPFFSKNIRRNNFNVAIAGDLFVDIMSNDDLWLPRHNCHKKWIAELVSALLASFQEQELFSTFIAVCNVKTEFCEELLPLIIFTLLSSNVLTVTNIISTKIQKFFSEHWNITVVNNDLSKKVITTNKSSVQSMLNVVHFVRLQINVRTKRITQTLALDYLKIAKAAQFCTAHFTALLYTELWCQEQINQPPNDYYKSTCSVTKLDVINENIDNVTERALRDILRQAYKAVGEIDALVGCGNLYLLDPKCRVEHYKEFGRWDQVIHHYEIQLSHGQSDSIRPLMDSLKNSNLYQLSLFCSNSLSQPDYESLWRLSNWDYNKSSDLTCDNYNKFKFYAFKALHDKDEFNFKQSLSSIRNCIVQSLFDINLESSKNLYESLTKLQSLKEFEDFYQAFYNNSINELLEKWKIQDDIIQNDFQYIEPIKAQRITLLTELTKTSTRDDFKSSVIDLMLKFAEYSRVEGFCNIASRTVANLYHIDGVSNDIKAKIQLEEAQVCWTMQDVPSARCILRQLYGNQNVDPRLHAMALKLTGQWMVESSSENRQAIIENYFSKSVTLLNSVTQTPEDQKTIVDTFDKLAKFADREYQQVMYHIKSEVFQKKKENIVKALQSINSVDRRIASDDLKRAIAIKQRQTKIDEVEIQNIENEKDNLLDLALWYYVLTLRYSDDYNTSVFRIISLLLENRTNKIIKSTLEKELVKISTYKFIDILPQMIPHIANDDLFSETVNNVIEKCAKDHPYHTLPLILSLVYAYKDRDYTDATRTVVNDVRTQNAKNLLARIKRNSNWSSLIGRMELLWEALIEVAYCTTTAREDVNTDLPRNLKLRNIRGYDDVLLPTCKLSVQKDCVYNNIIGIHSFGDSYKNVGGINAPKFIQCRGSDGIMRSQLVKGKDDLRQDAVMQQVFTIMNNLLAVNKQTKNLLIRTYKVVPLSMRSGILEWVENSMPLGEFLAGKKGDIGAHDKYRPSDWSPSKCRNVHKNAANTTFEEKLQIFTDICKHIRPVFHKFFEITFPQPAVWYERRRAYIHSVATTSMCGYILGLGDRHVSNILIDKSTAEVIHIDFGIAFEQGRVLPTPETVPFRLSRDIVDGMGVSGVEGVFRRSCEKTVEVLRKHHQTILTILQVLLYDPLYDWTVSSAEANKRQRDQDFEQISTSPEEETCRVDINSTAERALLRLQAKLQGTENGNLTTVEHQVSTLIQQAVDPSNLCRLFHGWQPFL